MTKILKLSGVVMLILMSLFSGNMVVNAGTEVTVTTETELKNAVTTAGTTATTISIVSNITLTSALKIPSGAVITLTSSGGNISGNIGVESLIVINSGGTLTIGANASDTLTISGNTNSTGLGGAIRVGGTGMLSMNGGTITQNNSGTGGAVRINGNGTFIMNNGTLSQNNSDQGGAVYIAAKGKFVMNGGNVSANKSELGGGIYAAKDSIFELNGGLISGNKANDNGGGIYMFTDYATINAGEISNNSGRLGGGIYTEIGSTATFTNMYVAENTAQVAGGGMWFCPDGTPNYAVTNGVAVINNTADSNGNQFHSDAKNDSGASIYIGNRILGGGKITWYNDVQGARYQPGDTPINVGYQDPTQPLSLDNEVSSSDAQKAKDVAKLFITNNTAAYGGGFASNGVVHFGTQNEDISYTINKVWNDSDNQEGTRPDSITIELLQDGVVLETAVLNEGNNWTYTFSDLPSRVDLANGTHDYVYTIREQDTDNYNASYSEPIVNGMATTITVTNALKKGGFTLIKQDATTSARLAGAEFQLQKADGAIVQEALKTDSNGEIAVTDLAYGSYILIETKAPIGYVLDATPVALEINEETPTLTITVTNTVASVKELPNTGSNTIEVVLFGGGMLILGLVALKLIENRKSVR